MPIIIKPLLDLLESIAQDNYTLKQLKNTQVKAQANATDCYGKIVLVKCSLGQIVKIIGDKKREYKDK